jgi:hypothetical protein
VLHIWVIVHRSGLVIHPEQRYIAGSPDGIVSVSTGETGLIEIKKLITLKAYQSLASIIKQKLLSGKY